MAELPPPTAQGDLSRTPFAHLLLYCHQRELTGTLVVWPEDPSRTPGQDRIFIAAGKPVAALLRDPASALDRGLLPLFARRSGVYAFYADLDLVGSGELVRTGVVDPLALTAASLRGPSRDDVVEQVLAGFGDSPVRFRPGAVDVRRFQLLPKEQAFIDVVRAGPCPIAELVPQCELGPQTGRRLLYLLAISKALEPWTVADSTAGPDAGTWMSDVVPTGRSTAVQVSVPPPRPSSPPESPTRSRRWADPEPPPPPPPELAPEHVALWTEVAQRAVEIESQDYFAILGLPRDASSDAVRKTYLSLVKKWHPDRFPTELKALHPWIDRIFQYLTAAHDTLVDDAKRSAYLQNLQNGGGTPQAERKLARLLQAATDQRKAEVLMKRRNYEAAAALLREVIELNPEDAHAHATYAWALYHLPPDPARDREMIEAIDRAISLAENNDRAHYYRGMIYRRVGREAAALAAFQRAATLNPHNIEAVREVRLANMRGQLASGAPGNPSERPKDKEGPGGGLLAKLFGSPKKTPEDGKPAKH
jgi:tetratricopeptide (TPR) repeat protein